MAITLEQDDGWVQAFQAVLKEYQEMEKGIPLKTERPQDLAQEISELLNKINDNELIEEDDQTTYGYENNDWDD